MEINPELMSRTTDMLKMLGLSSYEAQGFAALVYHGLTFYVLYFEGKGFPLYYAEILLGSFLIGAIIGRIFWLYRTAQQGEGSKEAICFQHR